MTQARGKSSGSRQLAEAISGEAKSLAMKVGSEIVTVSLVTGRSMLVQDLVAAQVIADLIGANAFAISHLQDRAAVTKWLSQVMVLATESMAHGGRKVRFAFVEED